MQCCWGIATLQCFLHPPTGQKVNVAGMQTPESKSNIIRYNHTCARDQVGGKTGGETCGYNVGYNMYLQVKPPKILPQSTCGS